MEQWVPFLAKMSQYALTILEAIRTNADLTRAQVACMTAADWMALMTIIRNHDLTVCGDRLTSSAHPRALEQISASARELILQSICLYPTVIHFLVTNLSTFTCTRRLEIVAFLITHKPESLAQFPVAKHFEALENCVIAKSGDLPSVVSIEERANQCWTYLHWLIQSGTTCPDLYAHICFLLSWLWLVRGDREQVDQFVQYARYPVHRSGHGAYAVSVFRMHPGVPQSYGGVPMLWIHCYYHELIDLPTPSRPEIFQLISNSVLGHDCPVEIDLADDDDDVSLYDLFWGLPDQPLPKIRTWLFQKMIHEWLRDATDSAISEQEICNHVLRELIKTFEEMLCLKSICLSSAKAGVLAIAEFVSQASEITDFLSVQLASLVGRVGNHEITSVWLQLGVLHVPALLDYLLDYDHLEIFQAVWDNTDPEVIFDGLDSTEWDDHQIARVTRLTQSVRALGMEGYLTLHSKMLATGPVFQELMDRLILQNLKRATDDYLSAVVAWCTFLPINYLPEMLIAPDRTPAERELIGDLFSRSLVSEAAHRGYLHRYRWPITHELTRDEMVRAMEVVIIRGQDREYIMDSYPLIADQLYQEHARSMIMYAIRTLDNATRETEKDARRMVREFLAGVDLGGESENTLAQPSVKTMLQIAIDGGLWKTVRMMCTEYPVLANRCGVVLMVMRSSRVVDPEMLNHSAFSQTNLIRAALAFLEDDTASHREMIACLKFASMIQGLDFHLTQQGNFYLTTPASQGFAFWHTRKCGDHMLHFVDHGDDVVSHFTLKLTMARNKADGERPYF